MRLAVDREPGDVELPHQRRLIDERVVFGRREHRRVCRFVEAAGDLPAAWDVELHHARPRSMTLRHQEELRAREERVVRRDPRLIRGEHVRQVIEIDGDTRDPPRLDSPGLLAHQRRPQLPAARRGDSETKNVLRIVLNHIPAWRPYRQREIKRRLVDVPDVCGDVKELTRDIGDLDRVLDLEPATLSRCSLRQQNVDAAGKKQDQRAPSDTRGGLQVDHVHDFSLPGPLAAIISRGQAALSRDPQPCSAHQSCRR